MSLTCILNFNGTLNKKSDNIQFGKYIVIPEILFNF